MKADARRDGRPEEYWWRPMLNAADQIEKTFASGKIPLGNNSPKMYIFIQCSSPRDGQTSCKVWLTSVERRRCSNEAKTRNPLKFAGVPHTRQPISAVSGPKFSILWGHVEEILLFNSLFPIVDKCLSCEDIVRQSCAMVRRWRIFASCISSEPHAAYFRPAF